MRIKEFADVPPTLAHCYIAYIVREGCIKEIITTNYDTCMETAYEKSFPAGEGIKEQVRVVLDLVHYRQFNNKHNSRFPLLHLYKINGCSRQYKDTCEKGEGGNHADKIVLTERQLQSWRQNKWAKDLFRDRCRTQSILFSGFGSQEPQIRHTVLQVMEEFSELHENGKEVGSIPDNDPWEHNNSPFVAEWGELTFYQYQILYSYLWAHHVGDAQDAKTIKIEDLKEGSFNQSVLIPLNGFPIPFVRNSCFFYQDGVENTLGRHQDGFQGVAGAFVGDLPNQKLLLAAFQKAVEKVKDLHRRYRAFLGDEELFKKEAVKWVVQLEQYLPLHDFHGNVIVRKPEKLVTAAGKFSLRVEEHVRRWAEELSGNRLPGKPLSQLIETITQVIEEKKKQLSSHIPQYMSIKPDEKTLRLKEILGTLPDYPAVDWKSEERSLISEKDKAIKKKKDLEEKLQVNKKRLEILLSERQLTVPGTQFSVWMGEIPLLASFDYLLTKSRNLVTIEGDFEGQQVFEEPWYRLLRELDANFWRDKLKEKWRKYQEIRQKSKEISEQISGVTENLNEINKREKLLENLSRALELWVDVFGESLEQVIIDGQPCYDVRGARQVLEKRQKGGASASVSSYQWEKNWGKALDCLRKWQDLEQRRETARLRWSPEAKQAEEKLSRFLGWANQEGITGWLKALQGKVLKEKYLQQLNYAMALILLQFGSVGDLADHVHFERAEQGHIVLRRWRDQEFLDHDVPFANTLSTAQINQVAIAYMLALNQGTEDHPLGFICLDDVSSAFDLQNLAADAHLIRMLAYGNKSGQQRQVFITSHHDEITTRLLPLLLPPRGSKLKIIEFVDWDQKSGPKLKCYECRDAREGYEGLENAFRL